MFIKYWRSLLILCMISAEVNGGDLRSCSDPNRCWSDRDPVNNDLQAQLLKSKAYGSYGLKKGLDTAARNAGTSHLFLGAFGKNTDFISSQARQRTSTLQQRVRAGVQLPVTAGTSKQDDAALNKKWRRLLKKKLDAKRNRELAIKSRRRAIMNARSRHIKQPRDGVLRDMWSLAATNTDHQSATGDGRAGARTRADISWRPSQESALQDITHAATHVDWSISEEQDSDQHQVYLRLLMEAAAHGRHGNSIVINQADTPASSTVPVTAGQLRTAREQKLRKRRKLMALRQAAGKHMSGYKNILAQPVQNQHQRVVLKKVVTAGGGGETAALKYVETTVSKVEVEPAVGVSKPSQAERMRASAETHKLSQVQLPRQTAAMIGKKPGAAILSAGNHHLNSVEFVDENHAGSTKAAHHTPSLSARPEIRGRPGRDYPIYDRIPDTGFRCNLQRYWGMYADPHTRCQTWHYCDRDGSQHTFLCPNGTVFSQSTFTCDWWFNVDCTAASQLYVTNEPLSLLPAPPDTTFPEDFSGPIVDWYIYQRHQEKSYRKAKFLKLISEGVQQKSIRFLETHDLPPWFSSKDQKLYRKLKHLERISKLHMRSDEKNKRPVKKALAFPRRSSGFINEQ